MWLAPLPVACVPSWQLTQFEVTPVWSNAVAGDHAVVEWTAAALRGRLQVVGRLATGGRAVVTRVAAADDLA
jgi:hypothetical protein